MDSSIAVAQSAIDYVPIATTLLAAAFAVVLWRHWQGNPQRYLLWWALGVTLYGLGTLTEAATTLLGWNEPTFRLWYVAGALLGGAPLAQGTVYLLLRRRTADRLTIALVTYVGIATAFVLSTPLDPTLGGDRLTGKVMAWSWVRLFSPVVNLYAFIFLVGGAAWSAWRYHRRGDRTGARVTGNALIAVGALLPGIGGTFTRLGHVEVLYATEFVGLALIWFGYRRIVADTSRSIHTAQQRPMTVQQLS